LDNSGPTKIHSIFNGKTGNSSSTLLMYHASFRSTSEQADRVWEGLFVQRSECDVWIWPSRQWPYVQTTKGNQHNTDNTTKVIIYNNIQ
jgi:hypothetical protein